MWNLSVRLSITRIGSWSVVFLSAHNHTGEKIVLKRIPLRDSPRNDDGISQPEREIRLRHPNLLRLVEVLPQSYWLWTANRADFLKVVNPLGKPKTQLPVNFLPNYCSSLIEHHTIKSFQEQRSVKTFY
jgi:hypothetical protein